MNIIGNLDMARSFYNIEVPLGISAYSEADFKKLCDSDRFLHLVTRERIIEVNSYEDLEKKLSDGQLKQLVNETVNPLWEELTAYNRRLEEFKNKLPSLEDWLEEQKVE